MEEAVRLKYKKIYALQDEVLNLLFSFKNDFYITGGTALHRFYCGARYSDDLDMFMNAAPYFSDDVKTCINLLKNRFTVSVQMQARNFFRIDAEGLQIDFVNDEVYKYGRCMVKNGIVVDNVYNILSNKLTALLGRDEEKDVFDIICVCLLYDFQWEEILAAAHNKAVFDDCILIERLKTFPLTWVSKLKVIRDIKIDKGIILRICNDITLKDCNSLYKAVL